MAKKDTQQQERNDNQKLRKAYGAAAARLREAHREEFNRYQQEEAVKLGIEWSPRPTGAERARRQIEEILAEHPELRDDLASMAGEQEEHPEEGTEK